MIPGILGATDWVSGPGDDTAAIASDGGFLLAAGEGMFPPFVAADPYGAGVASVVANVNDVAAMGGRVVASPTPSSGPRHSCVRRCEACGSPATSTASPWSGAT